MERYNMYSDDQIQSFYQNYRDSLDRQLQTAQQNLEQQRRNQQQAIMSGANAAGMMYSNFPERAKIQFDTETYTPNVVKLQQTYQTGLDKLRSNIVNYQNSISQIQKAIADLNAT